MIRVASVFRPAVTEPCPRWATFTGTHGRHPGCVPLAVPKRCPKRCASGQNAKVGARDGLPARKTEWRCGPVFRRAPTLAILSEVWARWNQAKTGTREAFHQIKKCALVCGGSAAAPHYCAAPTASPAAHSGCPQLQAMENSLPALSQYGLQYFVPFATRHAHPGCAHLSGFFSAMTHLLAQVQYHTECRKAIVVGCWITPGGLLIVIRGD